MICDQFRQMPPTRHDRDPTQSAVLAHIQATLGCDLPKAISTFHYLRNRRHLVFNRAGRTWRGVEHTPEESDRTYRSRMEATVATLEARLRTLETQCERLRQANHAICDHLGL